MAKPTGAADGLEDEKLIRRLTRHDFPPDFIFGGSTSAYQVEGAFLDDRKCLNNWDVWTMQKPGKVADGNNGCLAIDHYNRLKEDVKLMKKLGIDCYRFSIQWSRILPGGRLSGGVNRDGVKFYNDLIDLLIAEGITPMATLFHFDVPQCLMDEYQAFMDRRVVMDFGEYAEVCFFEFGDRVKNWVTLNEPWSYTAGGYVLGNFPPGHAAPPADEAENMAARSLRSLPPTNATPTAMSFVAHRFTHALADKSVVEGDAGVEPYKCAHHLLLCHAKAVEIYRANYQAVQGGKIGITNNSTFYEPYIKDDLDDIAAAKRGIDFQWGWFVAPVVTGDYPPVMRERVKERLPVFTEEESKSLKGSFDFLGMNYYTTYFAQDDPAPPPPNPTYLTDQAFFTQKTYPDGTLIGDQAASEWLLIVPRGIYGLLKYNAEQYNNPITYITENGVDEKNLKIPITEAIQDDYRINFFRDHFFYTLKAIKEGINVKGYLLWSLFDNFEWSEGYTVRFGLYYVDYLNGLTRYPKKSAIWFMNFLNKNLPVPNTDRKVKEIEADDTSAKKKRART